MKITRQHLKQIIKEVHNQVLKEQEADELNIVQQALARQDRRQAEIDARDFAGIQRIQQQYRSNLPPESDEPDLVDPPGTWRQVDTSGYTPRYRPEPLDDSNSVEVYRWGCPGATPGASDWPAQQCAGESMDLGDVPLNMFGDPVEHEVYRIPVDIDEVPDAQDRQESEDPFQDPMSGRRFVAPGRAQESLIRKLTEEILTKLIK